MNKKILITYRSKTWKTKKYAEMIAGELGIKAVDYTTLDKDDIKDYDIVVYGAGVYAGRINGLKEAKETFSGVKRGSFIVFATGGTPNTAETTIAKLWDSNLPGIELERIPHYYMQAGVCYEKMGFKDRIMMKIAASVMESQRDKDFVHSLKQTIDISDYSYCEPLVERLRMMDKAGNLKRSRTMATKKNGLQRSPFVFTAMLQDLSSQSHQRPS